MIIDKTNWTPVKLADISIKREETDKTNAATRFNRFLKVEHLDVESLHINRWGSIGEDELPPTFYKIFRKGQMLYPTRNPHLKRAALASFDGICGEKTLTLEPIREIVDDKFYPFIFLSQPFHNHTTSSIIGSTNPHVRWRDVAEYEFLLPPKEQQAKLAELLWAGDKTVEEYNALLVQLQTIKSSLLNKLKEHGNKKPLKRVLIQKKVVSNVPHNKSAYLGLEHFDSGSFWCTRIGESKKAEANCFVFENGDLLYSKLRPYLDKAAIVDFEGVCSTELLVYNTTSEALLAYTLAILHSPDFIHYVNSKSFGTKMPRTSHEIIGSYQAYIPSIEKQRSILQKLELIHHSIKSAQECLKCNKNLQVNITNQIFS